MSRPHASLGVLPDDLYLGPEPWPRIGRPPKHDVETWTVTDDWSDPVPITDAERARAMLRNSGSQAVTPRTLSNTVGTARQRIRLEGGGYRRDHLRALAQRDEVAEGEVRIMGSKSRRLQRLVANGGANAVPTQGQKWRRGWDSNPRYGLTPYNGLANRRLQPLGHPSSAPLLSHVRASSVNASFRRRAVPGLRLPAPSALEGTAGRYRRKRRRQRLAVIATQPTAPRPRPAPPPMPPPHPRTPRASRTARGS